MLKLTDENSTSDVIKSLCCTDKKQEECFKRRCKDCQAKEVKILACEDWSEEITYEKWIRKVTVIVKKEEKLCQRRIKTERIINVNKARRFILHILTNQNLKSLCILLCYTNVIHLKFTKAINNL
ncbi:hypothetical protein PR048_011349 [Dryococelus australis]|uniref:Uncharacterized protein n=1 Tax=Dryococelus australis TaxID=614101 RepID=A0ABQ9HLC3_9NEOP|nr:hypothetical protein PR048_011349 [Dryococelus australis]